MSRVGRSLTALATVAIVVACTPATLAPGTPSAPPSPDAGSPSPSPIAAAASPTPAATDQALPSPGGTCTAAQFASGQATISGEPSTLFTRHVAVFEDVRNTGPACVLAQPKVIGLASASGPFVAFTAPSLGQLVIVGNTGHYTYPDTYPIKAGQSFRIDLNASWWYAPGGETPPPQFPCHDPLSAISRAEVPLASGTLRLSWDPPLTEVCTTPPTLSIGFEFM